MLHFFKEQFKHWFYTLQTAGSRSAFPHAIPVPGPSLPTLGQSLGKRKGLTSGIYHGGGHKEAAAGSRGGNEVRRQHVEQGCIYPYGSSLEGSKDRAGTQGATVLEISCPASSTAPRNYGPPPCPTPRLQPPLCTPPLPLFQPPFPCQHVPPFPEDASHSREGRKGKERPLRL